MIRLTVGVALAALLAACSPDTSTSTPSAPAGSTNPTSMGAATVADFKTATPLKEIMGHMVDFAAFGVWNRQGWLIDAAGVHDLFPETDAEWLNAESAAISLAETSNVLLLPGRPPDDDRKWVDNAHELYNAAMKAKVAAEAKDKQAFFDAGGDIYQACTTCHAHYVQGDEAGPVAKLPALPNRVPPPNQ